MSQRVVLITGCSAGGLGHALAKAFREQGSRIIATARDPSKVDPSLLNDNHIDILPLDVTDSKSIAACVQQVREMTNGRLDILVNNAGGAIFGPLVHASVSEGKALYDVNVWGVLAVAQGFTPLLVQSKGVILNICSMAGAVPLAWQGIYNSSKAAATFVSETLRLELAPLHVRVVTAMVGAVGTQIYTKHNMTLPEDSYYKPIEKYIAKQASGELQEPNNEDINVTARNIVRDTLGGRRGKIWRGGEAGAAKYGSWLLPTWFVEWLLHQGRGLFQLKYTA
ncbi:hypothetical protein BDV10DRAFT_201832 [Aspergillus recurvatus]